jgi:hypothetical protein
MAALEFHHLVFATLEGEKFAKNIAQKPRFANAKRGLNRYY